MASKRILLCTTTLLLARAILANVNIHNYNAVHRYPTAYENDWRPVLNKEAIKFKPAHRANVWSAAVPVQPGLKIIQEYSANTKIHNAQKGYESREIYPSKILENVNHFTHTNTELLPSETRKYSFLLPTNRDPFILQDNSFKSLTMKPSNREATPYYSNIPKSFLVSEMPHPIRQHFFTENTKPSYPLPDRSVVTYINQNLNKQFPALPSVEFNNKFSNNITAPQNYNGNGNFQTYNTNFPNNFNPLNQTNSQKITKINNQHNLVHEYPEKTYVTAFSRVKVKPIYQNYVIPSKMYAPNLLPMQVNYLHHYSSNVKKNNSESHPEEYHSDNNNNNIESIYKVFRGPSIKSNLDLTYIIPKFSNITQKEANLKYTTPDTQQYFKKKEIPLEIPEYQTIQNKYKEEENIHFKPYISNRPFKLLTSTNTPLEREFPRQTEISTLQNKYNDDIEEFEDYEGQEKIQNQQESLKYSGFSDQLFSKKYNSGQGVELKNNLLTQSLPQNRNRSHVFYENVLPRLPVTKAYSLMTELPFFYNTVTPSPITDTPTEATVYTTIQTVQITSTEREKELKKVKSDRFVGQSRRRPTQVAQRALNTTPKINVTPMKKELITDFETNKDEEKVIDTEINAKFIKNKSDSEIESTKRESTYTTETFTRILGESKDNFATTEELNINCSGLCSSDKDNYEYEITSTQTSIVSNQDYTTESLKISTINNYENTDQNYGILTTVSGLVTHSFSTKYEPKISATTPATIVKTTPRIRFSKPINTLRPRFSVKDYKTKLDDRNRKSQTSTTESNAEIINIKKKSPMDRKQFEATRDVVGRYKYMSRIPFRTSTTTPTTENQGNSTPNAQIRKKINKYVPKERFNLRPLNISRTPFVFSTKQKSLYNFTHPGDNNYSLTGNHGESKFNANTSSSIEGDIEIVTSSNVDNRNEVKVTPAQNKKIKHNFNLYRPIEKLDVKKSEIFKVVNNFPKLTNEQEDEELLEKASQSVADLTSSASSLHNKGSTSKAVSQSPDKTIFLTHFKSTYDTPTLPIEAFFHDLSDMTT
ncbi:uncharacterized protein LOC122511966 [Leptopilina heterotoma]|uniref:uncharacterized protein LOC122511966 n=1 Tax=Leptopilina heterotoma TaxID=63436 RepID=UPI001CA7EF70|nr:uncharacterized protein LOC122511966 [Leptopilina heterotoma]XP_043483485.1 uncharacterized protein LOC122511966 [Leptopilina heterotoma]XP_043483487.1 uncharacterized protein LOC122511966 [Leptopilina heterotoma]